MGTLLMVAVTLIAGTAVFSFVNGQAATSEGQYGQAVAKNVNYLNERYEVVNSYYSNGGCSSSGGCFSVSFYNNGNVALTITELTITNSSGTNALNQPVGWFKVVAFDNGTVKAYNRVLVGHTYVVSICNAPPGSTTLTAGPIAENSMPPATYTVTVPTCSNSPVIDGAGYTIQAFGLYGNIAQTQVEASW